MFNIEQTCTLIALVSGAATTTLLLKMISKFSENNFWTTFRISVVVGTVMSIGWPLTIKHGWYGLLSFFILVPAAYCYANVLAKFLRQQLFDSPSNSSSTDSDSTGPADSTIFIGALIVIFAGYLGGSFVISAFHHFGLVAGTLATVVTPLLAPAWMVGGLATLILTGWKAFLIIDKWSTAAAIRLTKGQK
jgi:hypothetical protein